MKGGEEGEGGSKRERWGAERIFLLSTKLKCKINVG